MTSLVEWVYYSSSHLIVNQAEEGKPCTPVCITCNLRCRRVRNQPRGRSTQASRTGRDRQAAALAGRGGAWFRSGLLELHLGVQAPFQPATKGHPGILVTNLDDVIDRLRAADRAITPDDEFPGFRRVYTADVFGNRLEFLQDCSIT